MSHTSHCPRSQGKYALKAPSVASDTVPLAEFDPPMARAVSEVLRRAGVPAEVSPQTTDAHGDALVVVPDGRREEAFEVLARSMEDVQAQLRSDVPERRSWPALERRSGAVEPDCSEDGSELEDDGRPLLFERLRQLGFLPLLLVPLMVVTLAQVRMPGAYTAALVIGGIVALYAWRNGRRDRT